MERVEVCVCPMTLRSYLENQARVNQAESVVRTLAGSTYIHKLTHAPEVPSVGCTESAV